jgi:hypothetical protein
MIPTTSTPSTNSFNKNLLNTCSTEDTQNNRRSSASRYGSECTLCPGDEMQNVKSKNEEATRQQGSLFFKGE